MVFELSENDDVLILRSANEAELDQLNLSFEKEAANAKWDPRVKKGWWNGKINYFKSNKYLPAGLWKTLVDVCKHFNFELEIKGIERKFDNSILEEDFVLWVADRWKDSNMKPRHYQIEAAFKIIKYKSCLAELATSAGKTLIMFMVLSYLLEQEKSKKILIIVPTVDLVIQSSDDFYEYNEKSLKLGLQIQQVYAGSIVKSKSNIVIGTYQSLTKKDKEYFSEFDTIIVDEVHSSTCVSTKTILSKCENADRKFGLSGTIPKENTLDRLTIMAHTGPIITSIKADYLIEEGYITPCEVFALELNYAPKDVREAFKTLNARSEDDRKKLLNTEQNYVIQSEDRLNFIVDSILKSKKNSLVLFFRIEYGNKIYEKLREKTERRVFYIDGETDKSIRELHKNGLSEGEGKIMVASFGTFATGINISNIHTIYLCESFKSEIIIRQSIGRGLRKHASKEKLIIIDFIDDFRIDKFKNYLYKHGLVRQEIYKEQNFPFTVKTINL